MAVKITPEEFSLLIQRLNARWRVLAPSAEFRGGRFADTDNIIYQQIRGWDDLVWQEKSHMSPNTVISPITETLFYFNKDTIQIAETDTTPVLIFARACDINAMSRLDYMYLSNGNNSDYSYQRLRDHIRFVLIECPQSFENCFCVSMGSNKTDNYSAAMRFSDDGASVFIKDAFFEEALQGMGQSTEYEPVFVSENLEQVTLPEKICQSPQKVRDIIINHPLWDEYNSRCIGCG
ncbi:anaerobic sulfite reductase subunit A, partial [Escherichia coli]|nr:anaerobic sulfite reductase subunit A [Escherichia coli]